MGNGDIKLPHSTHHPCLSQSFPTPEHSLLSLLTYWSLYDGHCNSWHTLDSAVSERGTSASTRTTMNDCVYVQHCAGTGQKAMTTELAAQITDHNCMVLEEKIPLELYGFLTCKWRSWHSCSYTDSNSGQCVSMDLYSDQRLPQDRLDVSAGLQNGGPGISGMLSFGSDLYTPIRDKKEYLIISPMKC